MKHHQYDDDSNDGRGIRTAGV
eukprot:COSAG01_NODE_36316_length_519_cov_1.328571_1_plen_21_part_10